MIRINRSINWQNFTLVGLLLLLLLVGAAVATHVISWGLGIFLALFGIIVLGLATSSVAGYLDIKRSKALSFKYPDEPWMWDARWQSDLIPSRSKQDLEGSVFVTVIVSLLAIPMIFVIPRELSDGNLFALLAFIPIVVAVSLGRYAYNSWCSGSLEKHMLLFLETRPAYLGAELSARLLMPGELEIGEIKVTLEHIGTHTIHDSDGTSFEKRVDRQIEARIKNCHDVESGRIVSIEVQVPQGSGLETSWGTEKSDSYWDLVVEMHFNARLVCVRYEVPVAGSEQYPTL